MTSLDIESFYKYYIPLEEIANICAEKCLNNKTRFNKLPKESF